MNYYIYEITNNINGKKYIGKRVTKKDINKDDYMGSGLLLEKAKFKYGIENFSKQILEICNSKEQLSEREIYYISLVNAPKNPMYYNVASGGEGGNTYAGKTIDELEEIKRKIQENRKFNGHTEETKAKISEKKIKNYCKEKHPLYGKHHSEETKRKLSEKNKGQVFSEERNKKVSASTFGGKNHRARKVKCIETSEIFNCIADVERKYNIDRHKIISSCKGKRKSGVKINNIETHWIYID